MTHFFDKRDAWGNRLSLWVIVLMAFVAPLCWWSLRQFHLDNDVEKWLPDSDSEMRSLRWAHEQFPIEERILLTWDGNSINDPRIGKLVERLVGKPDAHGIKRGGLPYVSSVTDPLQSLDAMQRNGIEPREAVRRLEGTILGAGMLRLRLTEAGRSSIRKTKRELQAALLAKYKLELGILDASADLVPLVSVPAPIVHGTASGDPSPPTILLADGKFDETNSTEHDLEVAWKGMRIASESTIAISKWLTEYIPERGDGQPLVEHCFFVPGAPVALAIGISEAGLADKAETVAAIRAACIQTGIAAETLHLAGSAVTATELNEEVLKAVWDPSFPLTHIHKRSAVLTSAIVCALLAFSMVRNIRLASIILFVSLFSMASAMAIVPVAGGSMNMVLIVMPVLLFVLTMSSAIHVANYWKHAACRDEAKAITQTVRMSWKSSFPATLTVAIGFVTLSASHLVPIRDFGIYAAIGTMISLVAVVIGIPSLMQLWNGRPPKQHEFHQAGWRAFGHAITTRPGLQSLLLIAICLGCSLGLRHLQTETKVIRYFPDRARIARDYWSIETTLAGTMPVELIVRFDQQSQRETNFIDRIELVRQIQNAMRTHPEISGSLSLADYQKVAERPPEDAGFLQKTKYNKRAAAIEQSVRDGELSMSRSYYTVSEHGSDLNELGDNMLNQPGDELWRISAQVDVMSHNDFARVMTDLHQLAQDVLKLQPGSHHLITGAVPVFVRTQLAVLTTLCSSFGLAFALIVCVFMIRLRSVAGGLVAMIPNIAPIAIVFGVMSWIGERIDIGSMMTASIALGIAVDGTLHFINWMRSCMKNGRSRREAVIEALVHCGPAMCQTSAVVAIGLALLVPAELLLISRFGAMMAALIGVSLIGNIILLPQLMCGPLGRLFELARKQPDSVIATSAVLGESTVIADSHESAIPSPHIQPDDAPTKKRRTTSRKRRDAG